MTSDEQTSSQKVPRAAEWIAQSEKFVTRRGHQLSYRRRGTGSPILLLHGFPTWSYDYAGVATNLAHDHDVITMDFLGYGASDKPNSYDYSVAESADSVEDLVELLKLPSIKLVVHDYGGIVGQELVDRQLAANAPFKITELTILNCGIVYNAYKPTLMQKLLIIPVLGRLLSNQITAAKTQSLLESVWGKKKLSAEEFNDLWHGIALKDGHKLAYLHIRYNTERERHHQRWETALEKWESPLQLIWGLDDPVSGAHVLELATKKYPRALVTKLDGVGHFPQVEAAEAVASAIRTPPAVKALL